MHKIKLRNVDLPSKPFNAFSSHKSKIQSTPSHLTGSRMDAALQRQDDIPRARSRGEVSDYLLSEVSLAWHLKGCGISIHQGSELISTALAVNSQPSEPRAYDYCWSSKQWNFLTYHKIIETEPQFKKVNIPNLEIASYFQPFFKNYCI